MTRLRLCFAGTPDFAAAHLACLIANQHSIAAVYTQPDRPAGRGKKLLPSPVKVTAQNARLPIKQPQSLRGDEAADELRSLNPDLMVVVAYGLILPQRILDIPRLGCINVHASLLPRWRGAAPIERAILAGDKQSGVTVMQMDAGLDTGPMLHRVPVPIEETDDSSSLLSKTSKAGQQALLYTLDNLDTLQADPEQQDQAEATYAEKITKEEFQIDWSWSAQRVSNVIRAGAGRMPAWSFIGGERVRLLSARVAGRTQTGQSGTTTSMERDAFEKEPPGTIVRMERDALVIMCGDAAVAVTALQLPGKKPVSIRDLVNSNNKAIKVGSRFGDSAINCPQP